MLAWQFLCVVGIAFVILEIFTPSLFFLNFALAAFITAFLSLFIHQYFILVLVFFVLSFFSFLFLRPIIIKKGKNDDTTGIQSKYVGHNAMVLEDVSEYSGVISIYDERWEARCEDKTVILKGSNVRILRNEGLVMFVVKIEK